MNRSLSTRITGVFLSLCIAMTVPFIPAIAGVQSRVLAADETLTGDTGETTQPTVIATESEPAGEDTSIDPTEPSESTDATQPTETTEATEPAATTEATEPSETTEPTETTVVTQPTETTVLPETSAAPQQEIPAEGSDATLDAADGVTSFVNRCYTIILGRTADTAGLTYWRTALYNKTSTAIQTAYSFLFSPEYINKNVSNDTYVTNLYQMMFGRNPDQAGKTYWLGLMSGGSTRQMIVAGFANSPEFRAICDSYGVVQGYFNPSFDVGMSTQVTLFVMRLYYNCMGRSGDNAGISYWTSQIVEGRNTGVGVAYSFFFSPDCLLQEVWSYEYVYRVYETILGRDPSNDEAEFWSYQLRSNQPLEAVFGGIVNSQEFYAICTNFGAIRGTFNVPATGLHYVNAGPELKDQHAELYFIPSDMKTFITTMPAERLTQYQIQYVGTTEKPTYSIESGNSVTVDANGLVTRRLVTSYWTRDTNGGWYWSETPSGDPSQITKQDYVYGSSIIDVKFKDTTLYVYVYVDEYRYYYSEDVMNTFVKSNITASMTSYQKVDTICKYLATFGFSNNYMGDFFITKIGTKDDYAYAFGYMCDKAGLKTRILYDNSSAANYVPLVLIDGVVYSPDFGDSSFPANYYRLDTITNVFSFEKNASNRMELAYYLGFDSVVNIPSTNAGMNVTDIATYSLRDNDYITKVVMPNTVTTLGSSIFADCDSLTEITLSSNLKTISSQMFYSCDMLNNVTIPSGVTTISSYAFQYCYNLTKITIPATVTSISSNAFEGHSSSLKIYGKAGSYAQTYATSRSITFVAI